MDSQPLKPAGAIRVVEADPDGPKPAPGELFHLWGTWGPGRRWTRHRFHVVDDGRLVRTFAGEAAARKCVSRNRGAFIWDARLGGMLYDGIGWTAPHSPEEGDTVAVLSCVRTDRRRRPGGRRRRRKLTGTDPLQRKLFE